MYGMLPMNMVIVNTGRKGVMRSILRLGTALGLSVLMLSCGGYDTDPKNRSRCLLNMHLIYKALSKFSEQDRKPAEHLGEIFPRPFDDHTRFRCPSSSDDPTKYQEGDVLKPSQCSYIYNNLGIFTDLDDDLRSKLILIYEKKEFHGPGRHVVFASGSEPEFLPREEFNKALAFTEQWMKENK